MPSLDVQAYLSAKGLRGRPASGGRELVYPCFFDCAEPANSKKRKLYINVEEGVYSCLTGETQVLTRAGIRPIADLAGGIHEVVTAGGKWVNAPFYHFGRQPVRTITLSRNGVRKTLRATSHHRWLHETRTRIGRRRAWATTDELRPGMILAAELPLSVRPGLDPEGIRHGIVFGDGTRDVQRLRWRVVEVGGVEPEEDVFCAVVDGTESFVLDDFILTGNCKVCGATGGPYTLQKHFGDDPRTGTSDDAFTRRRILAWAAQTGAEMLANRDDVLLHLMTERGLSPETIIDRQLGFVGSGWSLTGSLPAEFTRDQLAQTGLVWKDGTRAGNDYFYNHLLIPIIARGQPIQIRGRAWGEVKGGKYMSGPGESVRAYNIDSLDGADEVILTEGEFDAIRLAEVLATSKEERARKIAVVGLPGTNAWPEELDDYLADLKRIYLGLDSDEPGKLAAEKLREKFGARARVLSLPNIDGRKADWTEYLLPLQSRRGFEHEHPYAGHDATDVLRLMSEAAGKRIHSVAEAGAAFRAYRATNTGLQTGWHQLDGAIAPGLLPGQIVFILAKTGTGKTLILCSLAYQMRRQKILFISLEMTREEVYSRLQRVYWHHHPDASVQDLEYALANVWICDENRLGERDLMALVNEYEMENGAKPDLVFVDYLGYYARGARGSSPYEKTTNAAMQLKADAKAGRLVIISPAQVNRLAKDGKSIDLDDARDSGAVEETGDFVFAAVRPDNALNEGVVNVVPTWKIMLTILKSRHGGVGKNVQLQMDALTLALCEVGTNEAKIAEQHNFLYRRGKTWEQLRAEQTAPRQLAMPGGAS